MNRSISASIVRSAIDTSRPVLEAARHQLTVDIPTEPIAVAGDAVRLTQVFANLLTNAAKYTNAGGHIWLTVRTGGRARDRLRPRQRHRHSGRTSSPRCSTCSRRSIARIGAAQGGLGIGLTLVRSLVTMHGGRVEARSPGLGAGSEFIVELPILDRTGGRGRQPRRADGRSRRGGFSSSTTIAMPARRWALCCRRSARRSSVVDSGRAALEILETFNPDAVLLDIGMPDMDGYEVSRRIRATADHRDVLLIALTGWGQEHDYRRSHAAGFDHHLVKPPDIDKLRDLVTAGRQASAPTDLTA